VVAHTREPKRFAAIAQITYLWRQDDDTTTNANSQSLRTAGNGKRESIVPWDKECINEMGVARHARRGSRAERAG
jgi:hypothetical protein